LRPEVSVLMPVHNAAGTLPAAMRSILRQDFEDFELVVVDDGSDDESPSVMREFMAKDRRVRVFTTGRAGLVETLNKGLAAARGRLVARMDSDDVSHPRRLGLQVRYMAENPDVSIVGSAVKLFPRRSLKGGMLHYEAWVNSLTCWDDIRRDLFVESPLPHPSVMFRKDAVEALGGYRDMGWPEDYDLWLRMAAAGHRMAKLPETLLYWREGEGRLSRSHGMYSPESFRRVKARSLWEWRMKGTRRLQLWGAGRDGKTWAKLLMKTGFEVVQFIDIDKKKVGGQACGGIPVVWPSDIIKGMTILCAVGIKGAREQIRDYLTAEGFKEPDEFFFLA